jgi:GNAT superfamily N-acetyltransferase
VSGVRFPRGLRLEPLRREHSRRRFRCGEETVENWLATKAFQHQEKHLSVAKALLDKEGVIAGYYTLATGQVDFNDLPAEVGRDLPRRLLPVAVLVWLGVNSAHQGRGLGGLLLAQALRDCWEAGKIFTFIAVVLDCVNDATKGFYQQWGFSELPGHPYRLFVSAKQLDAMMKPA